MAPRWSFFSSPASSLPEGIRGAIPCTGLDLLARDLVMTNGFIIDARLDGKKIEESMSTLIARKFPRAGARLGFKNGVYEFRIPNIFDSNTPPLIFTSQEYHEPYRSPARASKPLICSLPALDVYLKSRDCPASVEEFLLPNIPLVHVHVTAFEDLTFVGITSPHVTFDALGTQTLLFAWTRLINGEDIDAIPGMEWDVAPFETFKKAPSTPHLRGWFNLGLFGQLLFAVRVVLPLFWDSQEVINLIRVPKVFLKETKREIMEDLKLEGSSEYVGSSDVLLVWWLKTVYSHRGIHDTTPIHLHLPANLRGKHIFPGESDIGTPYINNTISGIHVPPIPVNAFQTESLGELAVRIRRALEAYNADLGGIRADLHWRCTNPLKVVFPCPSHGEYSFQTNWQSEHFGALDFSGACAGGGGKTRVMLALGHSVSRKSFPMRGNGALLMDDEDSIWMMQIRGKKDWEKNRRSGSIEFFS
ncbi:hypothetical protein C8R43DRAFT_921248 [Mycena crocata]|nr:hypothetical protein C8R43DRAFT_921248 [Mycena crocata]